MEPTQGRFEVEKFDGDGDFTLWKHKIQATLEILGFESALKKVEAGDSSKQSEIDPKWLEKDRRVRNLLSMSLSDAVLRKVMKKLLLMICGMLWKMNIKLRHYLTGSI